MAKINREKVIILLQEKRKESREYYSTICDILERNSIIGRKNKEKMINDFIESLSIPYQEANILYNDNMDILIKERMIL